VGIAVSASVSGPGVETRCALDPTSAPASFGDLPVGACPTSVDANGSHVVYAASRDNGVDGAVTSASFKIDRTKPTLSPTVSPNPVLVGGSALVLPNASDAGGVSTSCGAVITSTVGNKTVSCTATDNAGNQSTASAAYAVVYGFSGFAAPLSNTGLNIVQAGQAIALKWRMLNASGAPVTNLATVTVTTSPLGCETGTTVQQVTGGVTTGKSGLQNLGDGYYQYNWTSPKNSAGTCATLHLDLGEGGTRTVRLQFKK
jgi:hypothetical protein